jgi:hypothetical protein
MPGKRLSGDVGQQPGDGDGGTDEQPVDVPEAVKRGIASSRSVGATGSAHEPDHVERR